MLGKPIESKESARLPGRTTARCRLVETTTYKTYLRSKYLGKLVRSSFRSCWRWVTACGSMRLDVFRFSQIQLLSGETLFSKFLILLKLKQLALVCSEQQTSAPHTKCLLSDISACCDSATLVLSLIVLYYQSHDVMRIHTFVANWLPRAEIIEPGLG